MTLRAYSVRTPGDPRKLEQQAADTAARAFRPAPHRSSEPAAPLKLRALTQALPQTVPCDRHHAHVTQARCVSNFTIANKRHARGSEAIDASAIVLACGGCRQGSERAQQPIVAKRKAPARSHRKGGG